MRIIIHFSKLLLLVFAAAIAGGCVNQAMSRAMASWQDRQVSEVIAAWDKPSEELKIEGKLLLLWNTYEGKRALPGSKKPAPQPNAKYCVRLLEADKNGRIINGTWDGNDCPGWLSGWYR